MNEQERLTGRRIRTFTAEAVHRGSSEGSSGGIWLQYSHLSLEGNRGRGSGS